MKRRALAPNVTVDAAALQDVLNAILGLAEHNDRLFAQVLELTLKQECLMRVLQSKNIIADEEIRAVLDHVRAGITVERVLAGKQTAVERIIGHFSRLMRESPADEQGGVTPNQ
jgi:hypothetical protein